MFYLFNFGFCFLETHFFWASAETGLWKQRIGYKQFFKSYLKVKVAQSYPTFCNPMDYTWNSLDYNTGVGSLSFLQGIFLTQGLNLVSQIIGRFITSWATSETHIYYIDQYMIS